MSVMTITCSKRSVSVWKRAKVYPVLLGELLCSLLYVLEARPTAKMLLSAVKTPVLLKKFTERMVQCFSCRDGALGFLHL